MWSKAAFSLLLASAATAYSVEKRRSPRRLPKLVGVTNRRDFVGLGIGLGLGVSAASAEESAAPEVPTMFKRKADSIFNFEPGEEFCYCIDGTCRGKNCNGLKPAENSKMTSVSQVSATYEDELAALRVGFSKSK